MIVVIEIEHRCEGCNTLVRLERAEIAEDDTVPQAQVFDELCKVCQQLQDEEKET